MASALTTLPSSHASLRGRLSLETVLQPSVLIGSSRERIATALAGSRLVVIRDAFQPSFAERVRLALESTDAWAPYEGSSCDFHFKHHNLYDNSAFPEALAECRVFFGSAETKGLMGELSGRDCSGPLTFSASWYMPGDFSLPHTDCSPGDPPWRQVSFLWHLATDWDRRWGGHLYWGPSQVRLPPSFNTLVLFAVRPEAFHCVLPVASRATGRRLAVSGWWNGSTPYEADAVDVEDDAGILLLDA